MVSILNRFIKKGNSLVRDPEKIEILWLVLATAMIAILSIYWKESLIGIISAISGVICVILTGKGKLSCYLFGTINCLAYAYIAYQAKFYGDVMENLLYSLPMQFIGFYTWKKHMNRSTSEVIAERMTVKSRYLIIIITFLLTFAYGLFLKYIGGNQPYLDSLTNILSLVALFLSVRRYMEQWVIWIIIDIVTVYMWGLSFVQHQESLATLLMWSIYLLNAIIMFIRWYKNSGGGSLKNEI